MNTTEFVNRLKAYVEAYTPNYQDDNAETLLEMLFNVYTEFNGFDNQIIREDFNNLYAAMNGKTLREMDQIAYAGPVVQAFRRSWCIDSGLVVHAFR